MRCLALDIGGTKIASAIIENGEVSNRQQVATPTENVSVEMHSTLKDLILSYEDQFDAVAVASTGIINKGILTALNPKNLGGLADFPLYESIARHTDKPIGLLNDVQAAVCAEYEKQDKALIKNFAFITVSTGVGGGLIINGKLFTGTNGIAGHIGHSLADPNGAMCGCGRRGCVEAMAAGRAIEAVAQTWETPCSPKEVFERFRQGDEKATQLVTQSASAIAQLISDLVISLDIQKVVLGGSVGLAEGYLPLVNEQLAKQPAIYRCLVESAEFGGDAGLIGASYWLQHHLMENEQ